MSTRWRGGDRPEAGGGCGAQPCQARRRLKSQASARTAWAASIGPAPTLVLRTWGALRIEASLAAVAGTASSYEAEGRTGWTAQSRDWMFAPWLRGCLARWVGNELAGLLRNRVGCTLGKSLNAPTEEADRNSSLASRKTRSLLACILGQRDTAQ